MSLVNVSTGGVLIEAPFQLRPGTRMTIEMLMSAERLDMPLRLLRCYLSELKDGPRYRAACEFDQALRLSALLRQAAPRVEPRFLRARGVPAASLASEPTLIGHTLRELRLGRQRIAPQRAARSDRSENRAHLRAAPPTLVISNRSWLEGPIAVVTVFDLDRSETWPTRADRRSLRACLNSWACRGIHAVSRRCGRRSFGVPLEILIRHRPHGFD